MSQFQHKQADELFEEYQSRVKQPILDSWIEKVSLALGRDIHGNVDEIIMHTLPVKPFFAFTINCCSLDAEIDAGTISVTVPFDYDPGETVLIFTSSEFHVKDNSLCFMAETEEAIREKLDILKELNSAINQELSLLNTERSQIVKAGVQKRLDEEESRRRRNTGITERLREWVCK